MTFESTDPTSPHWSEPKYPTEEEIAQLPEYIHPATRWSLAFISFIAGCVAAGISVMRLVGDKLDVGLVDQPAIEVAGQGAAWVGLVSGLCWMMAGVTIWRGRIVATGIWFLLGMITGIVVTFL